VSGFEIGCVGKKHERDSVSVSLEDKGVQLYVSGGLMMGGWATLTPAQSRELGHLLIKASDNHDDLVARKKQIEGEQRQLEERKRSLITRALFGESS
jgi:hypothetical protein